MPWYVEYCNLSEICLNRCETDEMLIDTVCLLLDQGVDVQRLHSPLCDAPLGKDVIDKIYALWKAHPYRTRFA